MFSTSETTAKLDAALAKAQGKIDAARKGELFQLAQSIAAQVQQLTRRGRERCLLRQLVEILLDS